MSYSILRLIQSKMNSKLKLLPALTACILFIAGCYDTERTFEAQAYKRYSVEQNEAAVSALRSGDIDAALTYATNAVEHDPEFAPAHINKALILARLGRTAEAIEVLDKCIEIAPDLAQAYLLRGIFFERDDHQGKARESYSEAIRHIDLAAAIAEGQINLAIQEAIARYLRDGTVGGLKSLNALLTAFPENHPARMARDRMVANDREYFMRWATAPNINED